MSQDVTTRFWSKVHKTDGCWIWIAGRDAYGYGAFRVGGQNGRTVKAHRLAWELLNGPIPNGIDVLHACDNPACVRPDDGHTFLGTHQQNMADMVQKKRHAHGSRNGNAKLNETAVATIRQRISAGEPYVSIAKDYGVDRSLISHIKNGDFWKEAV